MALEIKHATQVDTGEWPDDPAYPVGSDEWNAALVATMATARLLGRVASGEGAVEELTAAQVLALIEAQGTAQKNAANGYAGLDAGGKIAENQLPAVAITDTFVVSSQAAMLALNVERGDIAVRTDINRTFVLQAEPASSLNNWIELRTPTDAVLSVAGKTGAVALVKGDVGLGNVDNTADANKPVSTAQQNALNGKQNALGYTPENAALKGQPNGYPALDGAGRLIGDGSQLSNLPASVPTAYGAVGTYVIAASSDWAVSTEYLPNTTVAGSTLYRGGLQAAGSNNYAAFNADINTTIGNMFLIHKANWVALGLSGTWRLMTRINIGNNSGGSTLGLFVRIA